MGGSPHPVMSMSQASEQVGLLLQLLGGQLMIRQTPANTIVLLTIRKNIHFGQKTHILRFPSCSWQGFLPDTV